MRSLFLTLLIALAASAPARSQDAAVAPSSMKHSTRTNTEKSEKTGRLGDPEERERQRRFEAAVAGLDSARTGTELKLHLDVFGEDFKSARPFLAGPGRDGSPRVRALVMKLFGDYGNAEDDLDTVLRGLEDHVPNVRMATVTALRRLGSEGAKDLLRHLSRERESGIRKMVLRNLKLWAYEEAIPSISRLLPDEKHPAVRKQMIRTLESLSGKRYGDDADAWLAFAEDYLYRKNEKRILEYTRNKNGKSTK